MLTERQPKTLRVFISSPGDVANERFLVRQLLQELPYDPFLRGNIAFDVISYDDPVAPIPLPANLTPQTRAGEAAAQALGRNLAHIA